jgi:phosphoribosylformylglycinamidine synthase
VYYQFREACGGMGDACRAFDTPVTGGNVSFYNENPNGAVFPTPVIGMLGLIEHVDHITTSGFRTAGDAVILFGEAKNDINGSEYLATWHGIVGGDAPFLDIEQEKRLHAVLLAAIRAGLLHSAHDVSDGGLAVCLAECCLKSPDKLGAGITLKTDDLRKDALYFGESQSRAVVTCDPARAEELLALAAAHGVSAVSIGTVGGAELRVNDDIRIAVSDMDARYERALPELLEAGA